MGSRDEAGHRFSWKDLSMTQSRLFRPRNLVVALARLLWRQLRYLVCRPRRLRANRRRRLPHESSPRPSGQGGIQERDRLRAEVIKLAQASKLDEAVLPLEKVLALTRELRGELHEDVVGSLEIIARMHELRDDWAAARKALTEVLAIRQRQPDQKDWRIADARRAVADLDGGQALEPAQRQRLREADRLNGLQDALSSRGSMQRVSIRAARPWRSEAVAGREPPRLCHQPEQPGLAVPGYG